MLKRASSKWLPKGVIILENLNRPGRLVGRQGSRPQGIGSKAIRNHVCYQSSIDILGGQDFNPERENSEH